VSSTGPSGQGNFFERLLGDLVQMMGTTGSGAGPRLEMARSFAHNVAAGNNAEPNVDPSERIRLEELARIAELQVVEVTGLSVAPGGQAIEVLAVGPGQWAWHTVEDWQFILTAMTAQAGPAQAQPGQSEDLQPGVAGAGGLGDLISGGLGGDFGEGEEDDLLNKVMSTMGPMLSAMKLGSAVGHLAKTTMGTYELPIPRPSGSRLLLVPANIARFAGDWGLALDEVRLWVCLRELTAHAVLGKPHVADRLRSLLEALVAASPAEQTGFAGLLGGLDPTDPDSIRNLFDDPEALLEVAESPERARVSRDLAAVTAALAGYVEYVLDEAGTRLLGDRSVLAEAWRRNQVEGRASMSSTEAFLGLDVGSSQVDRGTAFVRGVLERSGPEGLGRLWESAATLPTPSEVDAPGLWLERLKLQEAEPTDSAD
jgi:putative hydrolase